MLQMCVLVSGCIITSKDSYFLQWEKLICNICSRVQTSEKHMQIKKDLDFSLWGKQCDFAELHISLWAKNRKNNKCVFICLHDYIKVMLILAFEANSVALFFGF